VKARIVSLDEREQGLRATLNLGHTIGHALESAGGYTALTHGEAVALGLVAALRLGERLGHTPAALTERVTRLLADLELPHRLERAALERATALLRLDKKRARDAVKFVFAHDVGRVDTASVPLSQLVQWTPELADLPH
jgi:3-dehydroquinate synthetase